MRSKWLRLEATVVASALGDGLFRVAMPLLAVGVTRSPIRLGLVTAASYAPELAGPLIAPLLDRKRRLAAMVAIDAFRTVLVLGVALLVLVARLNYAAVLAAALLLGVCEVMFEPSQEAFIVEVVEDDDDELGELNGKIISDYRVADQFVGRPLGGLLYGFSHIVPVIGNAASYLTSAVSYALMLRRDESAGLGGVLDDGESETAVTDGEATGSDAVRGSYWSDVIAGFSAYRSNRQLLGVSALMAGLTLLSSLTSGVVVLFYTRTLGMSAAEFGALGAVGGALAVVASRLAPRLLRRCPFRALAAASLVSMGIVSVLQGLSVSVWQIFLLVGVAASVGSVLNVALVVLNQRSIDPSAFVRVRSAYRLVTMGVVPVGALVGATVAELTSLRVTLVATGLGMVALSPFALRIPVSAPAPSRQSRVAPS